jgi:dTDP-glucose 4,6-dehydratase
VPTALVTGGAGFLGSHLCDRLVEGGYRVICVDNLETGSLQNVEHLRGDQFLFINHDITNHLDVAEPIDVIYHLASPASPIDYLRLPLQTLKVGSHGTHNALGLAKWKRARFLLASTSEVYGDPLIHPQPETYWGNVNPIGPRGVYDEAKRYAEALTMAYHRQQGVDTCIVRIFNTYGPRMRPHDGRAIPTFVRQAQANEPLTVFGDGSQTRSFCYVDDLVSGLIALVASGEHLPVNIGNPASRRRCSRQPAPRARSCSRHCRSTTPRCASPTSRAHVSYWDGSRRCRSKKGCGGCCKRANGSL